MNYIASKRRSFLLIQCCFVVVAYWLGIMGFCGPLYILIFSVFNIATYGYLFYNETKYCKGFHPFQVLALAVIQFNGLNGIDIFNKLNNGESLYFGLYNITDSVWKGMCFLSIEHILLFAGFYILENKRYDQCSNTLYWNLFYSSFPFYKAAKKCYLLVWVIRIVGFLVPLVSVSSFLVNITTFGQLVPLFLLVFSLIRNPGNHSSSNLLWIITTIEIVIVLNGGMKENIIRNLIPYCVFLLLKYQNKRMKINFPLLFKMGMLTGFIILFVFPYISIFRNIANEEKVEWSEVSIFKVFNEYGDYLSGTGRYTNEEKGEMDVGYMMERAGSILCNTWSVQYAQDNGSTPEFLGYAAVGLVPRFIWPDKPNIALGKAMTLFVQGDNMDWRGDKYVTEDKSSTTIGFIGGCYFALGLVGALLIPLLMGIFMSFYWGFIKDKLHYNIMALWCLVSMLFILLKDFEGIQDCGLIFVFMSLSYMAITKLVDLKLRKRY